MPIHKPRPDASSILRMIDRYLRECFLLSHVIGAFVNQPEDTKMDIGSRISRKKEFVPPVDAVLSSPWEPVPEVKSVVEEAPFAFLSGKGLTCCKFERQYSLKSGAGHVHSSQ